MKKIGKYERVVPKKRLVWWKILLIVLAVVVALGSVVVALGWSYIKDLMGHVQQATYEDKDLSDEELEAILGFVPEDDPNAGEKETVAETEATKPPVEKDYGEMGKIINIMLVGQAYRKGEESKLADTMILCTINRETNTLTMTSFLRDTYVQLPNYKGKICGMQRINVCYNLGWNWGGDLGGMEMLDLLIMNNFGVEVDYNIELGFKSVVKLIDMMGGIPIVLTEDEANYLTIRHECEGSFDAGENLLAGDAALLYARTRHANAADNDFNRTARQRNLITQVIKKCMSMSPAELDKLLKTALPMILTDMDEDELLEMAKIAISMLKDLKIESNQCPAEGTYSGKIVQIYGKDAGVLIPNLQKNQTILQAIAEDGKSVEEAMALLEEME